MVVAGVVAFARIRVEGVERVWVEGSRVVVETECLDGPLSGTSIDVGRI